MVIHIALDIDIVAVSLDLLKVNADKAKTHPQLVIKIEQTWYHYMKSAMNCFYGLV